MCKTRIITAENLFLYPTEQTKEFYSFKTAKQEFEKDYTIRVLKHAGGNVSKAAKIAQKDRKDFYEVMKKYNIKAEDYRK